MPLSPTPRTPAPVSADGFRPRRSDDWHEYREIIEQLYRNDQLKLRDVKRIMEREYKFFASEKQYKDRLAAWNVRKNIKAKQVQLMVRKQEKRAARGKQTAFRMNGQEVDKKRIARFSRRYHDAWEKDRIKKKDSKQSSPEPATPSDMTCYTPEREDVSTPISPTEVSPTREAPYPLTYETIPDFVMDEDAPYHMSSNQSSRPPYHRSNSAAHPGHSHSHHQVPHPVQVHQVHHPHSLVQHSVQQQHHHHPHPNYSVSVSAATTPGATQLLPSVPLLNPSHRVDVDAPSEITTHPDDWNRLDAFQDRLQHLQYTLNQSMSKWARDQDSNQEVSHHEGLGL